MYVCMYPTLNMSVYYSLHSSLHTHQLVQDGAHIFFFVHIFRCTAITVLHGEMNMPECSVVISCGAEFARPASRLQ